MTGRASAGTDAPSCLDAALAYAARGWPVLPVHHVVMDGDGDPACSCSLGLTCKSKGKHPRINGWAESASTDEATIRAWWQRWPQANVGIRTGAPGPDVLDLDQKSGGLDTLTYLDGEGDLGEPLVIETGGGGKHFYYAASGLRTRAPACSHLPGLDTRGEGGFVVAPPSAHASGKRYEFSFDCFSDADASNLDALAQPGPLPVWLQQRLARHSHERAEQDGREREFGAGERTAELDVAVRDALAHIDADDYSVWLQVGMALHQAFGEQGFDLWTRWSQQSEKYAEDQQQRAWRSFGKTLRGSPVGLGTVFHLARQAGFNGRIPSPTSAEPVAIVVRSVCRSERKAEFALFVEGRAIRTTRVNLTSPRARKQSQADLREALPEDGSDDLVEAFEAAWKRAEAFANQVLAHPEPKPSQKEAIADASELSPVDIDALIEQAMERRDKDCDRRIAELDADSRVRAEKLGRHPGMLGRLIKACELLGHVGERENSGVLLLCDASCRLPRPLHALIVGQSSAGKSHLCETVGKLLPPEWVMSLTDMTPKFLGYVTPFELACRLVMLGERPLGDEELIAARNKLRREMISQRYLLIGTVERSSSGGNESQTRLVLGPISSSETTTKDSIFAEDQNRSIVLETNLTERQTELILERQAATFAGKARTLPAEWLQDAHNFFRLLKRPASVVVPFAELIADVFPKHLVEVRRLFPHFCQLIEVSAFLHQMQREGLDECGSPLAWSDRQHGTHRLVARPEDYEAVVRLVNPSLGRALRQTLSSSEKQLLEQLQHLVASRKPDDPGRAEFSTTDIAMKIEATTGREPDRRNLRKRLATFENHGFVKRIEQGSGHSPNRYRLLQTSGVPAETAGWQLPATFAQLCEGAAPADGATVEAEEQPWTTVADAFAW